MIGKTPEDVGFNELSTREKAHKLREVAIERRREAGKNAAAGFREIAEVQVAQAYELEERARVLEASLRRRHDPTE
jgi:hypothetical protein